MEDIGNYGYTLFRTIPYALRLAGVPAGRLFDFSGLLEFQQAIFLIFLACWSSSRAVF